MTSPRYETARYGDVPVLDAVATLDEESGALTLFAVNRHPSEPTDATIDLRGVTGLVPVEHMVLSTGEPDAANTLQDQHRVVPESRSLDPGGVPLVARLPAASWNVITRGPAEAAEFQCPYIGRALSAAHRRCSRPVRRVRSAGSRCGHSCPVASE